MVAGCERCDIIIASLPQWQKALLSPQHRKPNNKISPCEIILSFRTNSHTNKPGFVFIKYKRENDSPKNLSMYILVYSRAPKKKKFWIKFFFLYTSVKRVPSERLPNSWSITVGTRAQKRLYCGPLTFKPKAKQGSCEDYLTRWLKLDRLI